MNSIKFGNNKFCGPSVLSAIAGISTDEAAAVIQSITGQKRKVKSVYLSDLRKAFELIGYKTFNYPYVGNSVFGALFSIISRPDADGYYVFMVPNHFIAIELNREHKYICDNHTKEPLRISNSARLGQKVIALFKVVK